jgi:hypothetical protein
MHQPPTVTTWKITCQTPADAAALQTWLADRIDLDRVVTDTVRTTPNGVEQVQAVPHRLGDYFASIKIVSNSGNTSAVFRLVFQKRPDAGRFWKDLMVGVMEEIGAREVPPRDCRRLNADVDKDRRKELRRLDSSQLLALLQLAKHELSIGELYYIHDLAVGRLDKGDTVANDLLEKLLALV